MTTGPCYLDGNYFKIVLRNDGIETPNTPLVLNLKHDNDGRVTDFEFDFENRTIVPNKANYIRLVIHSDTVRHSTLLKVENDNCYWWNPRESHPSDFSKRLHSQIKTLVHEYIKRCGDYNFTEVSFPVRHIIKDGCNGMSGYCNAYVTKYALCDSRGIPFNDSNIEEFTKTIIQEYPKPSGPECIEYDFSPMGTVAGGLGGAVLGGALLGPVGAVAGGVTGGALGASAFSKSEYCLTCNWKPMYNLSSHSHNEYRKFDRRK